MRLNGIHHITAITADAERNVEFYTGLLGLRLVKKTVNFDSPDFYHLYYGDESGTPGSILTFFEFPGSTRGRTGNWMVHRLVWRVASREAIEFWTDRLEAAGIEFEQDGPEDVRFADPEGLGLELAVVESHDPPLVASAPDLPPEFALRGFEGVRAYSADPSLSRDFLSDTLGFRPLIDDAGFRLTGGRREALYHYDEPPSLDGRQGAGTVHHVAWAVEDEEQPEWHERIAKAGRRPTEILDRLYFHSIYFREPSGILFELATLGPGFTVDEPLEDLGEALKLPPWHESRRPGLEVRLKPLPGRR